MPKTVLIVDDSRMSRMMISTIIKTHHADWNIIDAVDGEQALEKVAGKSIDLMTLDMNMPGMDGLTLGEKLRTLYPEAHIALITANAHDVVKKEANRANFAFVSKPITEERIMDFVRSSQ